MAEGCALCRSFTECAPQHYHFNAGGSLAGQITAIHSECRAGARATALEESATHLIADRDVHGPPVAGSMHASIAGPIRTERMHARTALGDPYSSPSSSSNYGAHTPIVISELVRQLQHYPIKDDATILENGLREGFRIGYTGNHQRRTAPNLPSIGPNMREARGLIYQEVAAGRVAGPFKHPPFPSLRCSPIGLVPKTTVNGD